MRRGWTVEHAQRLARPAIAMSLFTRFASRKQDSVSNKVIAALRKEFGGHTVRTVDRG
jgi:6-phosphogluconate dehydrogenase